MFTEGYAMPVEFVINAANAKAITFLLSAVALPLLATGVVVYFIARKAQQLLVGYIALAGVVVLAVGIVGAIFWQLSAVNMKLDAAALDVGGGLYRVSVPMAQIDRNEVRQWTAEDAGYAPKWRTNGIGMPGVSLGWFTSSQSRIFAAITDRDNIVIIPTRAGYTILASPDHPQEFVEKIRAL